MPASTTGSNPTESNFRDQLSGFRWARGPTNDSRNANASTTSNPAGQGSYLSTISNSISGYVPLRSAERTNEEEAYLSLSRWERFLGFLSCLAGSAILFFFSFIFLNPLLLATRPHKFALSFSLASLLFMVGFSVLSGPVAHIKHMFSAARLPFSVTYLSSLALTLYFALGPRWLLPTLIAAVVQVCALLAYLAAYFPGGTTTLRYGASMAARGGAALLPF